MPDTEEKISALYDKSKSQLEPPEHLDAAIRTAARKAQKTRYRRIYPAMGLAATLVLGVGVAWLQIGAPPELADQYSLEEQPAAATSSQAAEAPSPAKAARTLTLDAISSVESETTQSDLEAQVKEPALKTMPSDISQGTVAFDEHEDATLDCAIELIDADAAEWQHAINEAVAAGDTDLVECLETAQTERSSASSKSDRQNESPSPNRQ